MSERPGGAMIPQTVTPPQALTPLRTPPMCHFTPFAVCLYEHCSSPRLQCGARCASTFPQPQRPRPRRFDPNPCPKSGRAVGHFRRGLCTSIAEVAKRAPTQHTHTSAHLPASFFRRLSQLAASPRFAHVRARQCRCPHTHNPRHSTRCAPRRYSLTAPFSARDRGAAPATQAPILPTAVMPGPLRADVDPTPMRHAHACATRHPTPHTHGPLVRLFLVRMPSIPPKHKNKNNLG